MFPYEFDHLLRRLRDAGIYAVTGTVLGALAGISGAVVVFSLMIGLPVFLLLLVGLAVYGLWYAVRRQRAGVSAGVFAVTLGLAQWPGTSWRAPQLLGRGGADVSGSVLLVVVVGLVIAPVVVSVVRSQQPGVNGREHD